ncbi:MAG: DUF3341 domain-containing protein [Cytophagia bacterium]|nr:DUF3341 domain-containing protein [Cytophagia bacterium]
MAMTKKYILGLFRDEEPLLHAVNELRKEGNKIHEVYTPFPVHGLDDALGYKRSRLPRAAFLFGCLGGTLGLSMQAWMLGVDWPMNIGGKPALAWVDFVPVTFELTVLITALGMVATYLVASDFIPGNEPKMPDPRITSDVFCIAIDVEGASATVGSRLRQLGAEVQEKEVEL